MNQPQQAHVLDQHCVDAGDYCRPGRSFRFFELSGKDERVESQIAADSAAAQERHQRGQFVDGEVHGPRPGVHAALQAKVHRIGAVFHGRLRAIPITGRRHQFGNRDCPFPARPQKIAGHEATT